MPRKKRRTSVDMRCAKMDQGNHGCMRPEGHRGPHKIREDPAAAFAGTAAPMPPRKAGVGKSRIGDEFAGLADLAGRIEREVDGLAEDCRLIVEALRDQADALRRRNLGLLKLIVKKRGALAQMRDRLAGARAEAALAREEAGEDESDEDEDEEG